MFLSDDHVIILNLSVITHGMRWWIGQGNSYTFCQIYTGSLRLFSSGDDAGMSGHVVYGSSVGDEEKAKVSTNNNGNFQYHKAVA
jgi:hypothetical protein